MDKHSFTWSSVVTIPDYVADLLPTGGVWT
jgi:hypothetical protein